MTATTKIEWCDSTFNPWIGCTKISPACDHCYAEAQMDTRMGRVQWGAGKARSRTSPVYWRAPVRWNANAAAFRECDGCGYRGEAGDWISVDPFGCPVCGVLAWTPARRRVFCASLADVFDNEADPLWRAELFELIAATPNLDWLLLTKRIGNAPEMMQIASTGARMIGAEWPLPNIWLGATICNQAEADRDIPKLLATPAARRFLSIEPMLGPIDCAWFLRHNVWENGRPVRGYDYKHGVRADWIICGGESGPRARPMHPDWARSLRDQCASSGVPFLFKQWGEWLPAGQQGSAMPTMTKEKQIEHETAGRFSFARVRPDAHISTDVPVWRVGKHAAGRLLDGVEHNGVPT